MRAEASQFWVLDTRGEVVFSAPLAASEAPRRSWVEAVRSALADAPTCHLHLLEDAVELEAWRMVSVHAPTVQDGPAIALCARSLSGSSGTSPARDEAPLGEVSMTPRQAEVSEYAASGATVHEIASHLGISAETVRSHLKTVYRNFGVANRLELARVIGHLPA